MRDDRSCSVSTLQPDPDIGSMEEMLRLRAAPPPSCQENHKRLIVIDLKHYTMTGQYGKGERDTITYIYEM